MDQDHEEPSTHEDRKTSTSSDAQFSEHIGYASGSVIEIDGNLGGNSMLHQFNGKESPLMDCKPLFSN